MLTPLDIENKKFAKQMVNGYSVDEVDDFLDQITVDYEKFYKEISDSKVKIEELNASLGKYQTIEDTLQNTLIMAQSTADEIKRVAQQQAEQIIADAQLNSRKSLDTLENELLMKKKEVDDVKRQFDIYKAKMESLLISQLELLKEINE